MQVQTCLFTVREVRSSRDPSFNAAMELYVETFPRDEREPIDYFARTLDEDPRQRGIFDSRNRLLVAELEDHTVGGMRFFSFSPEARLGFLVYVAVEERFRSQGMGTRLIESAIALCRADAIQCGVSLEGVLFEAERVELAENEEEREFRQRRLEFFRKRRASLVTPTYVQPALSEDKEPVPLNLFAYDLAAGADRADVVKRFYEHFLGTDEEDPLVAGAIAGCK